MTIYKSTGEKIVDWVYDRRVAIIAFLWGVNVGMFITSIVMF